jgi:hypothetical protein
MDSYGYDITANLPQRYEGNDQYDLALQAWFFGDVCGKCGQELPGSDTVYRIIVRVPNPQYTQNPSFAAKTINELTTSCRECWLAATTRMTESQISAYKALPCPQCHRLVIAKARRRPEKHFCCEMRKRRYYTRLQTNQISAERLADRQDMLCEVCGQPFTPARSDAKTCSAACKQKAYRQRQAAERSNKLSGSTSQTYSKNYVKK